MSATEIALDTLCAAMLASFARANRLLAGMPLPADARAGGPDWSDDGSGPIPWQQFSSGRRLALASAELTMTCYARRSPGAAVLSTQPPPWWQRLGRTHAALELQLAVADGVCTPRLLAASGARRPRAPRATAPLRLTLSAQQQAQLAELRRQTQAARRGRRWLPRLLRWLLRWLQRLTGTVTK